MQSALLQAMQEREVSIGEQTFEIPKPFMVLATQNPLEQEGTYPLPEAQLDRFLMKILLDYPSEEQELGILELANRDNLHTPRVDEVFSLEKLFQCRQDAQNIYIDQKIDRYIVAIIQATRNNELLKGKNYIECGASPRASIALKRASQARAYLRNSEFVSPDDVQALACDILRHRIITTFEADAEGRNADEIINELLNAVTIP